MSENKELKDLNNVKKMILLYVAIPVIIDCKRLKRPRTMKQAVHVSNSWER